MRYCAWQLLLVATCAIPTRALAQSALRVLRYTPTDSGGPSSIITVTFDRPVAGMLGRSIDAATVMRVQPAAAGIFEWRDPITLRFIPREAFAPGTPVTVAIDTAAIASSGARSGEHFTFTVRIPGPTPLAHSVEGGSGDSPLVGPRPTFAVLYSAPVNLEMVGAASRVVFPEDCGGAVPLRVVRQRAVLDADRAGLYSAYPSERDTTGEGFHRIVELVPKDSLPAGCEGLWSIVPFDEKRPTDVWRYKVRTYPAFRVESLRSGQFCVDYTDPTCFAERLVLEFSSPLFTASAAAALRTTPGLELARSSETAVGERTLSLRFNNPLQPRQHVEISVDTSLRDVYGRALQGPSTLAFTVPDRPAGVKQQTGLVSLARHEGNTASVSVRTVNVDTLVAIAMLLPDSIVPRLLSVPGMRRGELLRSVRPALQDTVRWAIPVHGQFNTEANSTIALPEVLTHKWSSSLFALRFEIQAASIASDSVHTTAARRANEARQRTASQRRDPEYGRWPDLGMIVQVSPLVAHMKIANTDGAVFVTDRAGVPVANATISLRGGNRQLLSQGTSSTEGIATLVRASAPSPLKNTRVIVRDPWLDGLRYVVVSRGNDQLIVPVNAPISTALPTELHVSTMGAQASASPIVRGAITPDRDLYRPGETVYSRLIARRGALGSTSTPAGTRARVMLLSGEVYRSGSGLQSSSGDDLDTLGMWSATLSLFGTAVDSIRIPKTAPLGPHSLVAEICLEGLWQEVAQAAIRVEQFRPPEFLVTVKEDTTIHFTGDTVVTSLKASYLFGAPMAGADVRWTAYSTPSYGLDRTIPNTDGFFIGRQDWWDDNAETETVAMDGSAVLDKSGHLDLRIPTTAGSLTRPSLLHISVAVNDVTTRAVTARAHAFLHPSSLLIAVKDRSTDWYWKPGAPQTLDVMVVRPTGARVAGTALRVTIVRRSYRQDTASTRFNRRSQLFTDTLQRWSITSADTLVQIHYTPAAEGAFDVRVEAADEAGHAAITNLGKYAYFGSWRAQENAYPHALKLRTQRREHAQFSLGDTALVSFDSPFERAEAWITLEREGIMEQRRLSVGQGTTTFPVPITERLAPNVWAGVILAARDPIAVEGADSLASLFRAGYVQLVVDSTAHLLRVALTPKHTELSPGAVAEVQVQVRDGNRAGAAAPPRAEVTLWAVDQGLLSMTGFVTPDIRNAIDGPLGVAATVATSLTQLPWRQPVGFVRPGSFVGEGFGGLDAVALSAVVAAGGAPEARSSTLLNPRANFRLTAFYVGSAITDRDGVATIRARLPENITTFRLMATAVGTGARYGSGEASLLVTRRVVLRPALPRFVRPGDSLMAVTALNVRSGSATLGVSVATTNATVSGNAAERLDVTADSGAIARFAITVPENTQAAETRVTFAAKEQRSGDGDAVATSLPIRPTGTPRTHTVIGSVRDSGTVTIALPDGIDLERSRLTLGLGTSPLVAMRSHYDQLRAYAYFTTDGVVAAARALLTMLTVERTLGERLVARDSITAMADLQAAVNTVVARALPEGGFSWLPGSGFTMGPWLTAYAGAFLRHAERAGLIVPASIFENIEHSLNRELLEKRLEPDTTTGRPLDRQRALRGSLGTKLVIARYLRDAGSPNVALEDSLINATALMAWEDRVSLTELMTLRVERSAKARALLDSLWQGVSVAGRRVDLVDSLFGGGPFPSHIRPAARLLTATLAMRPEHPLLGALSETIIQQSAAERGWAWNVHDHAAAIEGLSTFVRDQRGAAAATVVVRAADGRPVFTRATASSGRSGLAGDTTSVSLSDVVRANTDGSSPRNLSVRVALTSADARTVRASPLYFAMSVSEVPRVRPTTPDIAGIVVERWYERVEDGTPIIEAFEGDLVRVQLKVTVPADRQFVAMEDLLPAGLEAVDVSYRTSTELGPFAHVSKEEGSERREDHQSGAAWQGLLYGNWDGGWWSPWEKKEIRDDRVFYYSRQLWAGTYSTSYVARATTQGVFVRPPAHAEEMYNAAVQGRSDGGVFRVKPRN